MLAAGSDTVIVAIGALQVVLLALIAAWVRTRGSDIPSPIEAEVTLMDPPQPAQAPRRQLRAKPGGGSPSTPPGDD